MCSEHYVQELVSKNPAAFQKMYFFDSIIIP